jgi:hypothetical protein
VNEKQTHLTEMAATALPSVTPLVQMALKELGAEPPTTQILLRLSATLATAVNRWPGLKGAQKSELVVTALREVLAMEEIRGKLKPEEVTVLRVMVDTVVPETLKLVVAAGRGEIDLRKPSPGCFAALCRTGAAVAMAIAPQDTTVQAVASQVQAAAAVVEATASEKEGSPAAAPEKVELELAPAPLSQPKA